jgi:serine/threonine protein kinase
MATPDDPTDSRCDPLVTISEDYLARCRNGEIPSIEEYFERYPELADEIRDLFPTLGIVEGLKPASIDNQTLVTARPLEPNRKLPTIRDYRIFREIGRGGMGIVYEAEHLALGRRVALKVVPSKPGSDASSVERFRHEARAAAGMHHSNIVPVFDVGSTEEYNYYAMQFIVGDGLDRVIEVLSEMREGGERGKNTLLSQTEFALQAAAAITTNWDRPIESVGETRAAVETAKQVSATSSSISAISNEQTYARNVAKIGIEVASALGHAHGRGIIHRDIKPSNILLDTDGTAWVADFGLAKSQDVELTQTGNILGTLRYMSPERFSGPCDERGDIYGLGAALYEMLTLRPLYRAADHLTLMDQIKTQEPTPLREQDRTIPLDLETIVHKAIARDPARRYQTAALLSDDLQRFTEGRPILARRVGPLERLSLWANNNRLVAGLAASLIIGLFAVAVGSTFGAIQYRNLASQAQEIADEKAAIADEMAVLAKRNQTVVDSFVGAFRSADPENQGVTSDMTALEVLQQALSQIESDEELAQDELTKATLLAAIGSSLDSLGQYNSAISAHEETLGLRKAKLGDEHPDTLSSMNSLAVGYQSAGRLEEAISLHEETLRLQKATLGDGHPDTLISMNNLATGYQSTGRLEEALPLWEEALRLSTAKLGGDHPDTLISMINLAFGYRMAGRLDEAIPLQEETLRLSKARLGDDHPDTLISMKNLAGGYRSAGRLDEAIPLHEETLRLQKKKLGNEHPNTLRSMNSLAASYQSAGRLDEAIRLFKETHQLSKAKVGDVHPSSLISMNSLAECYRSAGMLDEAIRRDEETFRLCKAELGDEHPSTLTVMNNLAYDYEQVGRLEDAIPLHEETLRLRKAELGAEHPNTLSSMNNLAFNYYKAKRLDEAIELAEETLRLSKATLGDVHLETLRSTNNLAVYCKAADRLDDAIPLLEEAVRLMKPNLGVDHFQTLNSMKHLSLSYHLAGRFDEAIPWFEQTFRLMKTKLGDDHSQTLATLQGMQAALLRSRRFAEAEKAVNEWVDILQRSAEPDRQRLAHAFVSLAEAQLGLQRMENASEQIGKASGFSEIDEVQQLRADSISGAILAAQSEWDRAERLLVESATLLGEKLSELESGERWYIPVAYRRVVEMFELRDNRAAANEWKTRLTQALDAISKPQNRD